VGKRSSWKVAICYLIFKLLENLLSAQNLAQKEIPRNFPKLLLELELQRNKAATGMRLDNPLGQQTIHGYIPCYFTSHIAQEKYS
jgi:hypothetical protein